jgi:hypothetical protein
MGLASFEFSDSLIPYCLPERWPDDEQLLWCAGLVAVLARCGYSEQACRFGERAREAAERERQGDLLHGPNARAWTALATRALRYAHYCDDLILDLDLRRVLRLREKWAEERGVHAEEPSRRLLERCRDELMLLGAMLARAGDPSPELTDGMLRQMREHCLEIKGLLGRLGEQVERVTGALRRLADHRFSESLGGVAPRQ